MSAKIAWASVVLTFMNTVIGTVSDPCSNFTDIPHNGDRSTNCTYGDACDNYHDPGWYRFTEDNQTFPTITTECPDTGSCGTTNPIWINGTHPEEDGDIVNTTACVRYVDDCCHHEIGIRIKRCDGFFVYFLNQSGVCDARYCLDSQLSCSSPPSTTMSTSTTISTSNSTMMATVNSTSMMATVNSSMNSTALAHSFDCFMSFRITFSAYSLLHFFID